MHSRGTFSRRVIYNRPVFPFGPRLRRTALALIAIAVCLAAAGPVHVSAERLSTQPLLRPGPTWSAFGLFNPAAIKVGAKTILLFRAQDSSQTSRIGYAESTDGLHFAVRPEPVLSPEADYERN